MAKPTSLARLKQIVAEFRSLPSRIDVRGLDLGEAQTLRLKEAGRLLIDALNLGAFNLPEHRPFVDVVLRGFGQGTEVGAWVQARQILREKAGVDYEGLLSPADLVAQFAEDCSRMADALERDIHRAAVTEAKPIKRPPERALQAWRLRDLQGLKGPTEVAEAMTKHTGRKVHQGTVSRWLRQAEAYLAAGGIFPELPRLGKEPPSVDPAVIDMGSRQDRCTPRQRPRRDPDSDSHAG